MKMHNLVKRQDFRSMAALLVCGSLSAPSAIAQSGGKEDEVFELSPFVISGEDSNGYRATSTLAGTRIKTNLKDLGAAIQVVTEEFLEDTGATGVEDLLLYTTSTEIGGPGGNYSGIDLGSDHTTFTADSRVNPAQSARVRGVGSPNYTRNYFSTDIPIDSYNTSGITISRGPNSLLFGLGSAAGVIDNSAKMPVVGEESNKLSFRFGSHGSTRYTFDVVRTVIEDRLAIKASGLYEETQYRQEPAQDQEKRGYLAFSATLFKNENSNFLGKTTLRGNYEQGESESTPPNSLVPTVSYETFFQAPFDFRPHNGADYPSGGYDRLAAEWTKWKTIDTRGQFDPATGITWPGYSENDARYWPTYSTPYFFTNPVMVFQQDGSNSINHDGSGVGGFAGWMNKAPVLNPDGSPYIDETGNQILWRPNIHVNTRAHEEGGQGTGFKSPSIHSRDVFDFRNHLLTGDIENAARDFRANTFFLEQPLFNNKGGIEIAMDKQHYDQMAYMPFSSNHKRATSVYIDTSEYLNDGRPNPNVGRAFITNHPGAANTTSYNTTERDNKRVTAYYELDFNDVGDRVGKILGTHRFTGLVQSDERKNFSTRTGKYYSPTNDFFAPRGDTIGGWRRAGAIYYISPDLRGVEMDDIDLYQANGSYDGLTGTSFIYNTDMNNIDAGQVEGKVGIRDYYDGGDSSALKVESEAFAWQSYLLNNHIVGLVGLRTDDVYSYDNVPNSRLPDGHDKSADGQVDPAKKHMIDYANPSVNSGDTTTYSIVGHLPQNWVDKLPVSSLSAHWSKAENFQPQSIGHDVYNNPLGNASGTTEEMGVSLGFAEDKWLLRFNKFETKSSDVRSSINAGQGFNYLMDPVNSYYRDWQGDGTGLDNPLNTSKVPWENQLIANDPRTNYTGYADLIDDLLSLMPSEIDQHLNRKINDTNTGYYIDTPISNLTSTQAVFSDGYEIELVGNPTPNWRISANFASVEATPSESVKSLQVFNQQVLDRMKALNFDNNPLLLQTTGSIVGLHERWIQDFAARISGAAAKDGVPMQEIQKYRMNLVTNYSFSEGRFKGAGIGGSLRYSSSVANGSAYKLVEGVSLPDLDNLFYGPSDTTGDLWLSYKKRLKDNVDWKIQLNVRNLLADEDVIPIFTNPDGTQRVFRVAPETSWFLTNTFSF